jgi:Trypsin-like peptidase domain
MNIVERHSKLAITIGVSVMLVILLAGIILIRRGADSFKASTTQSTGDGPPDAALLLMNANHQYDQYTGIGRFDWGANCTGVFIEPLDTPPAADAPAYILTNGHCVGIHDPQQIRMFDDASPATITFNDFIDTRNTQVVVHAKTIAYAERLDRDIAIIELDTSYSNLVQQGIHPLPLASSAPQINDPLEIIGVPFDDYPAGKTYMRQSTCALEAIVNIREDNFSYDHVYRNNCPGIRGGSSGSPVLDQGHIVGLLATTTDGNTGTNPCTEDHPCEVTSQGVTELLNTSYGIDVTGIVPCFDSSGTFDGTLASCKLPSP